MWYSSACLGVRNLAIVLVLVVNSVVRSGLSTNCSGFGVIALAHLVRVGVLGQDVGICGIHSLASAEETEYTPASTIAGRVVVGRARTKSLFLTSVADKDNLKEGREDEEDDRYYRDS